MHRRKHFLVYPPDYNPHAKPYRKYRVTYSKYQAMKIARRMGDGTEVDESVHIHMKPRCTWTTSISGRECTYNKSKD